MTQLSQIGPPSNKVKLIFLESSQKELSKKTIFIDFGQVFEKLWQYQYTGICTSKHTWILMVL